MRRLSFLILVLAFAFPAWAEEAVQGSENPPAAAEQAAATNTTGAATDTAKANEEKKSDLRYLTKEELKTYQLRPADVIAVDVYNEPDLSREVQVDRKGFINYPLIGRLEVQGLTQEEVEKKIRDLFAKDYLVNPLVSMRFVVDQTPPPPSPAAVAAATQEAEEEVLVSYIVLGEVKKPGTYEFNPEKGKMTLLKAISIAGGFSDVANMSKIKLLHREGETTKSLTINAKDIISGKKADEDIKADDLIVVPESLI